MARSPEAFYITSGDITHGSHVTTRAGRKESLLGRRVFSWSGKCGRGNGWVMVGSELEEAIGDHHVVGVSK